MRKHLPILFILSFFCIVLPLRYGGVLTKYSATE